MFMRIKIIIHMYVYVYGFRKQRKIHEFFVFTKYNLR